jgi:hypothetical protein
MTQTDDNFEILALNGVTGECLTSDDAKLDAIRQKNEVFLTQLEALAVQAIAKGYWDEVYDHITCNAPETEDS